MKKRTNWNLVFRDNEQPDWIGGYILKYIVDVRVMLAVIFIVATAMMDYKNRERAG